MTRSTHGVRGVAAAPRHSGDLPSYRRAKARWFRVGLPVEPEGPVA
jgi:hypothetical protein